MEELKHHAARRRRQYLEEDTRGKQEQKRHKEGRDAKDSGYNASPEENRLNIKGTRRRNEPTVAMKGCCSGADESQMEEIGTLLGGARRRTVARQGMQGTTVENT